MAPQKRIALVVMILAACVGCDQRSKYLAGEHLRGSDEISLLADTIRLDYTENPGAFLGLGAFLPAPWKAAVFAVGCSIAIAAILLYTLVAARAGYLQVLGLSLICGGGIGNLVDRWAYGYVRDFLNVGLGPVRTGIFNVADVALMTGCLMVFLAHRAAAPRRREL
jgi:signal peptidase II